MVFLWIPRQPMPPSRSFQFGPFSLDAGGRALYRGGGRVALTPKAVDVLIAIEGGAAPNDAHHDALLRDAITRHGGNTLRIVDGAFCVAFADASAAVRAALDAQTALCAAEHAAIAVRMGLHSGSVAEGEDEELGGPTRARAARVVAAAQGGQILVTAATVALLDRSTLPGTEWRDLGDHTLRGFARPERLYQVGVPGLRSE